MEHFVFFLKNLVCLLNSRFDNLSRQLIEVSKFRLERTIGANFCARSNTEATFSC
jgi:hypothetical protein